MEDREGWTLQQDTYEKRLTKLRRTIKQLQDARGSRSKQEATAFAAVEEELRGTITTTQQQLARAKVSLQNTRAELAAANERYEASQEAMETSRLELAAVSFGLCLACLSFPFSGRLTRPH